MFKLFMKISRKSTIELESGWQKLLNTNGNYIFEKSLNKIKELNIFLKDGTNISTLHPLLFMPNLSRLNITRTYIKPVDFGYLGQFKQIKMLNISGCDVTNVHDLEKLNHLEELNIQQINIKTKELSVLNNFKNLKSLNIAGTGLRSLIHFQNNTTIEELTTSYSKGLKNMVNLKYLYLMPKDVIEIDNCPNIEFIRIGRPRKNQGLESMVNLKKLNSLDIFMSEHKINLSLLHKLENLKVFFLSDNLNIDSIKYACPSIKYLQTTRKFRENIAQKSNWIKEYFPNAKIVEYKTRRIEY